MTRFIVVDTCEMTELWGLSTGNEPHESSYNLTLDCM
jgi:hypothetical protein